MVLDLRDVSFGIFTKWGFGEWVGRRGGKGRLYYMNIDLVRMVVLADRLYRYCYCYCYCCGCGCGCCCCCCHGGFVWELDHGNSCFLCVEMGGSCCSLILVLGL